MQSPFRFYWEKERHGELGRVTGTQGRGGLEKKGMPGIRL